MYWLFVNYKSKITTRNSSADEITNVNFLRRHRTRTYSPQ